MEQEKGRSNKHLDVSPELFDESESSQHHQSRSRALDSMDNTKDLDHCDSMNERERMRILRATPEIVLDNDSSHHYENLHAKHLSPSSSSSSDSSMDNLFQVDTSDFHTSKLSTSIHQQTLKDDESCISMSPSHLVDADNIPGPSSTSQPSGDAQQAVIYGVPPMSPMSNPHLQVMDRSSEYDPDRIPSSAFAVSPNTPMDWSMASNDSLFSIHERNQSFSKDYAFMSDEFGKTEESTRQGELMKSSELLMFSPNFPSPGVDELTPDKNMEMENDFQTTQTVDEIISDQQTDNARIEIKVPGSGVNWNSSNLSINSDGSGASGKSFAFPILTDGMKNGSSKAFIEKPPSERKTPTSPMTASSKPKTRRCCYFTCTSCTSCFSWSCCSCPSFSCRCCFPCFKASSCARCCCC